MRINKKEELTIPKVKLLALSSLKEGHAAHRLIEFENSDEILVKMIVKSSSLNNLGSIKAFLVDLGYPPEVDNHKHWQQVKAILGGHSTERVALSKCPGFVGNDYLCADGKVIGNSLGHGPFFPSGFKLHLPSEITTGKLKGWKRDVAAHAVHSSRLMMSLCSAFSGFVIRFANMESGGFHFFGDSSIGKSGCLKFSASVCGGVRFVESWNTTDKAFEEMAAAHNDSILILDELKLVHEDPKKAAEIVMKRVYMIADGQGKKRTIGFEDCSAIWALTFLSAGEVSLNDHASDGGRSRIKGEQVRVVDIPADAGKGLGVFESLPKEFSSAGDFAVHLEKMCGKNHGAAKLAFLKKLTSALHDNSFDVEGFLTERMDSFIKARCPDRSDGQEIRIAKRFALVYAAGSLAIKFDVLPFKRRDIRRAITACYNAAIEHHPRSMPDKVEEAKARLLAALECSSILDVTDKEYSHTDDQLAGASGYRINVKGKPHIALKAESLEQAVPDTRVRKILLRDCVKQGLLIQRADYKNKRRMPFNVFGKPLNCYCFSVSALVC